MQQVRPPDTGIVLHVRFSDTKRDLVPRVRTRPDDFWIKRNVEGSPEDCQRPGGDRDTEMAKLETHLSSILQGSPEDCQRPRGDRDTEMTKQETNLSSVLQGSPEDCQRPRGDRDTEMAKQETNLSSILQVDDALEQFLAAVSSKVKGRRSEPRKRVIYKPRRMSCGAPSVTRLSFTDEDRLRFERENDGFPIAANEEEIRDFDNEVFSGDARLAVEDAGAEVKQKSRSKSLSKVAALAKLLKLPHVRTPTKPKFLDRLNSRSGLSKKCTEDSDDTDVFCGYSHGLTATESEPCSPVLDRDFCTTHADEERDASSPPLSPILPGLVKRRCESYRQFQENVTKQAVRPNFVERARSVERGSSDSPHARRCFSPVTEKADRLVKSFYSLSRDKNFSKAVMEKGYVRTLAEQINTGGLHALQAEEDEVDEGSGDGDGATKPRDRSPGGGVSEEGSDSHTHLCHSHEGGFHRGCEAKEEEEVIKCQCQTIEPHSTGPQNRSNGEVLSQSPSPSDAGDHKLSRSQSNTQASKEKRVWSPRARRKGSESPRSSHNPDAPTSSPPEGSRSSFQSSGQCSSPGLKSPRRTRKSQNKPAVDYDHKPKLGSQKASQSSSVNGESAAQKKCSRNSNMDGSSAKKLSQCRSRSSSRDKSSVAQSVSSMESECGGGFANNYAAYDNVFFGDPPMSPEELFNNSWSSDSDSEEFTDSEVEESSTTAKQVSVTEEAPPSTPVDKLHQIAMELLTTERTYVQRLSLLHQVFYFRIDQENRTHGFLPGDTLTQMFSSIQSIHQFHNDFLLKELEERMKNWESERRIGDLMKKNAPFLKLYTAYVKNFDNAVRLINHWLEKSPKFAAIIQEIQKLPECRSLSLQHHMLEPIQRVPRYELLLKDYFKHLPDDSPDRQDAQDALDLVTKAACHSNEAMKKIEKFHLLLDIYQRLRGVAVDFISPTRDFLREGPITKISARSGEKQSRYLFLFNDLLLICSEPLVGSYRVRAQLDVDGMEVKNGDNFAIPNTFLVHSKQKAIELLEEPPNSSETSWHEMLKEVIEDHRKRKGSLRSDSTLNSPTETECTPGKQAPRWIPDDAATMCMVCQQAFNPFRRRHHCRACGKLICKSCSKKAPLEYMNNKLERVCIACHDAIVKSRTGCPQSPTVGDTSPTKKRGILQVKADDPGLLAGYLMISDDTGKTWNKRWFSVHEDFVMYFFKARQDVSAYSTLPLPGYQVETLPDTDKPNSFRVHHKSLNMKGLLFQADNEKILKKWVNVLSKLVMAQLPDETQRLSSQSNSSSTSSGSDTTINNNNNNNNTSSTGPTTTTSSDKLSQADRGCSADGVCGDSVTDSSCLIGNDATEDATVSEKL